MARKLKAFEKQFLAARRSGAKEFSFGGKSYSTKLSGGGGASVKKSKFAATPKTAPTPTARPGRIEVGKVTVKPGRTNAMRNPSSTMSKMLSGMDRADKGGSSVRIPTPTPKPERPQVIAGKTLKTYKNIPVPTPKPSNTIGKMLSGMDSYRSDTGGTVKVAGSLDPSKKRTRPALK